MAFLFATAVARQTPRTTTKKESAYSAASLGEKLQQPQPKAGLLACFEAAAGDTVMYSQVLPTLSGRKWKETTCCGTRYVRTFGNVLIPVRQKVAPLLSPSPRRQHFQRRHR